MKLYAIKMKHVTPAKFAVDGKQHKKTLWYSGAIASPFGDMPVWSRKQDRKIFTSKSEARAILKLSKYRENAEVVEV